MAQLIPSQLTPKAREKSRAEGKIFDRFKESASDENVIVLHSVDFLEHDKKILGGECDFLVICRYGIFGIEVKGGGVGRSNGFWYTENHEGRHILKESPAEQAKDAIGSLKRWLKNSGKLMQFEKVVFGWGLAFPDVSRPENMETTFGPGLSHQNVFFRDDLRFDIQKFINKLSTYFHGKTEKRGRELDIEEVRTVAKLLRGEFQLEIRPRYQIDLIESFQIHATEQQYKASKVLLRGNSLITGGAGTGKTILASRLAIDRLKAGKRVLVICFNRKLRNHLEHQIQSACENERQNLTVMTVHSFLAGLIKNSNLDRSGTDSAFDKLCEFAFDAIGAGAPFKFDQVIFDEGQDFLTGNFLAVMDALSARPHLFTWAWFLDPNVQAAVFGNFDRQQLKVLRNEVEENYQNLVINCRNTSQIRSAVDTILGQPFREYCEIQGPQVDWISASSREAASKSVEKTVRRYLANGLTADEIKIISLRSLDKSIISHEHTSPEHLPRFTVESAHIDLHTASSFKGLECRGVIVVDVYSDSSYSPDWVKAVLYVAMTRGTYLCTVITDERFNSARLEALAASVANP
jgi:hypothetical protein